MDKRSTTALIQTLSLQPCMLVVNDTSEHTSFSVFGVINSLLCGHVSPESECGILFKIMLCFSIYNRIQNAPFAEHWDHLLCK